MCIRMHELQQPTITPYAPSLSCASERQPFYVSTLSAVLIQACAFTGIKADRVSVVTDDIIDKISGLRNTDGEALDFMHCLARFTSWHVSQLAA